MKRSEFEQTRWADRDALKLLLQRGWEPRDVPDDAGDEIVIVLDSDTEHSKEFVEYGEWIAFLQGVRIGAKAGRAPQAEQGGSDA